MLNVMLMCFTRFNSKTGAPLDGASSNIFFKSKTRKFPTTFRVAVRAVRLVAVRLNVFPPPWGQF